MPAPTLSARRSPPRSGRPGFIRGGALFLFAGLVLLGSLGVVIWVGLAQQRQIHSFTSTTPKWVAAANPDAAAKAELRERLVAFVDDLEQLRPTRILLTPTDLNHAVATTDELAGLRSIVSFRDVVRGEDGQLRLRADICFPSRTFLPWQPVPYLNGTMLLQPRPTPEGPWLDIVSITSEDGTVPEPVRGFYSQSDLFVGNLRNRRKHPRGSAALAQIGHAVVTEGGLLLATDAAAATAVAPAPGTEGARNDGVETRP